MILVALLNAAACAFNAWLYANSHNTINLAVAIFCGIVAVGNFIYAAVSA